MNSSDEAGGLDCSDLSYEQVQRILAWNRQQVEAARVEELEKLEPEFEMVPMISGWQSFPWATMKPEDQKEAKQWQSIHSHAAMYYAQFIKDRLASLRSTTDSEADRDGGKDV